MKYYGSKLSGPQFECESGWHKLKTHGHIYAQNERFRERGKGVVWSKALKWAVPSQSELVKAEQSLYAECVK